MAKKLNRDLKEILQEYSEKRVTLKTKLETLEIESLDVIEIIFKLEEKWNINIPPVGNNAETVGELNDILEEALSQKPE